MSDPVEIVKDMMKAVLDGDIEGVLRRIDKAIVVIEPASLPFGGKHDGIDAFKNDVLGAILRKAELERSHCEYLSSGDKVAVCMDVTFTAHSTGKILTMPYVELYTVTNNKISKLDVYPQDTKVLEKFWKEN